MTVVYLDRVLLLNLLVDYLLLLTTARLAGIPLRRGRLALCAAGGALYAGAVFLPGLGWLAHPLCRAAMGVAMALTAWRRESHPWRLTALFFLLSGALAGLLLAMGLAAWLGPRLEEEKLQKGAIVLFLLGGVSIIVKSVLLHT
mgnify:CR=1 FL=1